MSLRLRSLFFQTIACDSAVRDVEHAAISPEPCAAATPTIDSETKSLAHAPRVPGGLFLHRNAKTSNASLVPTRQHDAQKAAGSGKLLDLTASLISSCQDSLSIAAHALTR
jgi:hypothetical protein